MFAATVADIRHYKNFAELFSAERPADTGCAVMTAEQAALSMHQFYTPEQEKQYGVLAIAIKFMEGSYDLRNG